MLADLRKRGDYVGKKGGLYNTQEPNGVDTFPISVDAHGKESAALAGQARWYYKKKNES